MKKNEIPWDTVFGKVPTSFSARLDETIDRIGREKEMKKAVNIRVLLIAALLMLVLDTALALTNGFGIVDFFRQGSGLEPTGGAFSTVKRDLATLQTEDFTLTVREAVYDGSFVRALLAVTPAKPEEVVLVEEYDAEYNIHDEATGETAQEYAQRTGRRVENVGFVDIDFVNATMGTGTSLTRYEDETLLVYVEWAVVGEAPEAIDVYASVLGDVHTEVFTLGKAPIEEKEYAVENADFGGYTIKKAVEADTPFASEFTLVYAKKPGSDPLSELTENTMCFATPGGTFFHLDPKCSGMMGAAPITVRDAVISGKAVCSICIGNPEEAREEEWVLSGDGKEFRFSIVSGATLGTWVTRVKNETESISVRGGEKKNEDGEREYFATISVQRNSFPEGDLTLIRYDENGAEAGRIVLTAAK